MKKNIFWALAAFFAITFSTTAQNNSYNMVITLANGTTISIGPDEVKNISFNDGKVEITGQNIEMLATSVAKAQKTADSLSVVTKQHEGMIINLNTMYGQYSDISESFGDLISDLRTDMNNLAGQQSSLALLQQNCSTQCAQDRNQMVAILSDLQAQIGDLDDHSISELLTTLQAQVNYNSVSIETIMNLIGDLSSSESVIDLITDLQYRATVIENDMDAAEQTIMTLNELVIQLYDWKNNNQFVTQEVLDAKTAEIDNTISSITSQIAQITSDMASVTTTATETLQLAQNNQTIIYNHTDLISNILNDITTINQKLETFATKSELAAVEHMVAVAQAKADGNEILINNLRTEYEATKTELDNLKRTVTTQGERLHSYEVRITSLEAKAVELDKEIEDIKQDTSDNP